MSSQNIPKRGSAINNIKINQSKLLQSSEIPNFCNDPSHATAYYNGYTSLSTQKKKKKKLQNLYNLLTNPEFSGYLSSDPLLVMWEIRPHM